MIIFGGYGSHVYLPILRTTDDGRGDDSSPEGFEFTRGDSSPEHFEFTRSTVLEYLLFQNFISFFLNFRSTYQRKASSIGIWLLEISWLGRTRRLKLVTLVWPAISTTMWARCTSTDMVVNCL